MAAKSLSMNRHAARLTESNSPIFFPFVLMKTCAFLVLAGLMTGCGSGPTAKTDPRILQMHELHKYVDSMQVAYTSVQLKKLHYAKLGQQQQEANSLLTESTKTLGQLDAFDLSQAQTPGVQYDQLNFLLKQEGALLFKASQAQKQAVQAAQDQTSMNALMGAK